MLKVPWAQGDSKSSLFMSPAYIGANHCGWNRPWIFSRPPTCFKAFLAWMFSLPKFPDPSTWPWWLSIWLWWLEDEIGHPELKGRMKGWGPLISPICVSSYHCSSCNDKRTDSSILVSNFSRFWRRNLSFPSKCSCLQGLQELHRWVLCRSVSLENPNGR